MRKLFLLFSFFIFCGITKKGTHTKRRLVKSKPIFQSNIKKDVEIKKNKRGQTEGGEKDEHRKVPILHDAKQLFFHWPVTNGMLLKKDGYDKSGFLNFSVQNGVGVYASSPGVVAFVGKDKNLPGDSIIIYHDAGYLSIYSNLAKIKVSKGEIIQKNSKIIGCSKSLLYFSIRKKVDGNIQKVDFKKMLHKR